MENSAHGMYLNAFAKIKHHASARNTLLVMRLERFHNICPGKSMFQMLHVNVSSAVLSGECAASQCVLDDKNNAKFAANAYQLIVQLGKFRSVLKFFILGSFDLIIEVNK